MKIRAFDGKNVRDISADISKALEPVAKKYGIVLKVGHGTFDSNEFNKKLKFYTAQDVTLNPNDLEYKKYLSEAFMFDLHKISDSDYNKVFTYGKDKYRVVGLNPRGRKFPIIAENLTSGGYNKFNTTIEDKIANSKEYAK